jgi:hypothetical protein
MSSGQIQQIIFNSIINNIIKQSRSNFNIKMQKDGRLTALSLRRIEYLSEKVT